jgi:hypothetical protein
MRRLNVIADVVGTAGRQRVGITILMDDRYPTRSDKYDMAFVTPLIRNKVGAELDEANLNISELSYPLRGGTQSALLNGWCNQ